MKNHLINLLFEEYKLFELGNKLKAIGLDGEAMFRIFRIANIAFDLIGFPIDNSREYAESGFREYNVINGNQIKLKEMDEEYCNRGWLFDKLYELFAQEDNQRIHLSKDGCFIKEIEINKVKDKLEEYVDWLYSELPL